MPMSDNEIWDGLWRAMTILVEIWVAMQAEPQAEEPKGKGKGKSKSKDKGDGKGGDDHNKGRGKGGAQDGKGYGKASSSRPDLRDRFPYGAPGCPQRGVPPTPPGTVTMTPTTPRSDTLIGAVLERHDP